MRHVLSIIFATTIILAAAQTQALPRFGARAEQKCNLCHVNPSGGGMRNLFGSQFFAQTQLAAHTVPLAEISKFQPNVSDNISIGADMRTLYVHNKDFKQSTLFQMEGNFYLNAQVTDQFSVLVNKGLYSGFEVYGMGYYLPFHGYIRVGKFQPSYGWLFEDHTAFVRERMLWPPTYTDTGLEFGLYPFGISANLGFFNGTSSQFDENQGKAMAFRIEGRKHIGKIGLGVGGSYWHNDLVPGAVDMYGPFYYLNILNGNIIHLGELDWLKNKSTNTTSFSTTQNLSCQLTQGLWLMVQYDLNRPDNDAKAIKVTRLSLGMDYFPIGFAELSPMVRFYDDKIINDKYREFIVLFHFFY